ncbi:carboxypeptidase-like regulatory domain-containing protein [Longitalea luteola]|uniref:carboxypeptidase-like regulatory domain-containing protein n=1 Tax=Longitalea luteola TaxID=2812563 RepID=UPI001A978480|nr:carboxypeptidase-like regulatory domain-containing protein [Longitalea luteola]
MSDHKEHINQYTAADIQRYVQGKLSAREMHAMEKAALDDPFLADAIEGMQEAYAAHSENLVTGQLQQLQQQLQTRTAASAKVAAFKPFRYWQAAAAAVVIIITGVWIYSLVSEKEVSSNGSIIAKTEEKQPQQEQPPAPATVSADTMNTPVITNQQPAAKAVERPPLPAVAENKRLEDKATQTEAATESLAFANENRRQKDSFPPLRDEIAAAGSYPREEAMAKREVAPSASPAAVPELNKAKALKPNNNIYNQNRERETELITIQPSDNHPKKTYGAYKNNLSGVIKGQVTDFNSNPIANAYVQINKNNNNFITDKAGFFKIPVTDSVVDVNVNVTGYGTQNFTLQNNATLSQLQLQPANATPEDVVVTPPANNKILTPSGNSQLPNTVVFDAEPVFGWLAFEQYLEKNKKIPAGASSTSGKVVVSFEVNKKGTLSGFRIVQSLSKPFDDEAIRLIMQGPSWKLLKGRKARITVMVRF